MDPLSSNDLKALFVVWLEEMEHEAAGKQSRTHFGFRRAKDSLRKCKDEINGPKDLLKLSYFGENTVNKLTQKLRLYCENEGMELPPEFASPKHDRLKSVDPGKQASTKKTAKKATKTKKRYVPAYKSGGYAILLVLYKLDRKRRGLTKEEIIEEAVHYCDKSFKSNASTGQYHSAWTSHKTLVNHGLIKITGSHPKIHYMTDEGLELARALAKTAQLEHSATLTPVSKEKMAKSKYFAPGQTRTTIWNNSEFEVHIIIDSREIRSQKDRDFFANKLRTLDINVRVESLAVGDVLWIAKHKRTRKEVVLDFILERKRLDDLCSSIMDGRFAEQKSRLQKTGITNIHYLIEEQAGTDLSRSQEAMRTAISLAIVGSKFHVVRCKDSDHTARFLKTLTERIIKFYLDKELLVVESPGLQTQTDYGNTVKHYREKHPDKYPCLLFSAFQEVMNKTGMMTVKEMYVKMLMTVKGVGLEKAMVIQKYYPTPRALIEAYDALDNEKDKQQLLKKTTANEIGARSLGLNVSRQVYESWGKNCTI